jgi:hypothetical protein
MAAAELSSKVTAMTRRQNPFVQGKSLPPTHFIGRDEIINRCFHRLTGPIFGNVAINGETGLGKTSLLRYLPYAARKEGWGQPHIRYIFVHLYCPSLDQFTVTRFWHRILEEVKREEENLTLDHWIEKFLCQGEIQILDFGRFLRWLGQQGFLLVLLLDGFGWIFKTDTASPNEISAFLAQLRVLTNDPACSLILVTASRERLDILCRDIFKDRFGVELYNRFAFESLRPFTPGEIDTLLLNALQEADFEFDQADRDLLHHMAGAHPALLQMAGHLLFEERRYGPLGSQTYEKIIEDFERGVRHHFSHFWVESSPLEQTLLILIILMHLSGQPSIQIDMTGEEIQDLLQRYERNLVSLVERGLLQQIDEAYQIFSTVFSWWIVREVAPESENWLTDHFQTIREEPLRRAWQTFIKLAPHLTLDKSTQLLVTRSSISAVVLRVPPRFEVEEEIGRGAHSVIYKAFDTRLARRVAIKLPHGHLSAPDTDYGRCLLQEARATSRLRHDNIVTIYEVMEHGNQTLLVMEYVEGQPLSKSLQKKRTSAAGPSHPPD